MKIIYVSRTLLFLDPRQDSLSRSFILPGALKYYVLI